MKTKLKQYFSIMLMLAAVLTLPIAVTSCGDDDKDEPKHSDISDSSSSSDSSYDDPEPSYPDYPDTPGDNDDVQKLLGTWIGHDSGETYTISFYSSGRAVEEWTDGDEMERTTGTYKYSKGQITEWEMEDGSILVNVINEAPWTVTFKSSTKMVLKSVYGSSSMTFTKK